MSAEPPRPPNPVPPEAPVERDPVIGRRLADRYEVLELIARGGMARVYRARDERLEREVAIKVLSPPYATDPAFTARFLDEARAAASLTHPSLVHVYDSGSDGPLHFIVMELLDRHRSLREVIDEHGPLGVPETVGLAHEILAGLRVVHDRGLVHCDVKSGNVMLGPGPAKLIDFGIARSPHAETEGATSIGSLHFMSPEQLRGEPLTPASDLFALGVVLYEAITGRVPYAARTPEEMAAAHAAGHVRPPSTLAGGVPPRLDEAILQTLRPDPAARFHSAAALDRALEASMEQRDGEETRVVRLPPPAEPAEAARGYVPPAAAALPARREPVRRPPPAPISVAARTGPRQRRAVWSWLGTALVLGAATLVVLLIVVPLLTSGRLPGAGGTQAPTATEVPAAPPPGTVAVPSTVGESTERAIELAQEAGLNWTVRCDHNEGQREGIIDQEPPAGTPVAPGSRFTMYSARISDCRGDDDD